MTDAIKITLALLGLLALYFAVGTVEHLGNEKPQSLAITVPTLDEWCEDNPCACDDVGHKKLFVQAAD